MKEIECTKEQCDEGYCGRCHLCGWDKEDPYPTDGICWKPLEEE